MPSSKPRCLLSVFTILLLAWTSEASGVEPVTVSVRLAEGSDELSVELSAPTGSRLGSRIDFGETPFLEGPTSWNRFVDNEAGRTPPWRTRGTDLQYKVTLGHHQVPHDHGMDEVTHPVKNGWHLVGRSFIPIVSRAAGTMRVDLRWDLPTGWEVVDSLPPEATLADARRATFYVGRFHRRGVTLGEATVTVVSSGFDEQVVENAAEGLERIHERATNRLGPAQDPLSLVAIDPPPPGDDPLGRNQGGFTAGTVVVIATEPPVADLSGPTDATFIHELTHLWIHDGSLWFREGLTQYETVLAQGELTGMSELERIELFEFQDLHFQEVYGQRSLRRMKDAHAYAAGVVFGFCVDVELQYLGSDLGRILHGVGTEEFGWQDRTFFERLRDTSPSVARYARSWLRSRRPDDLQACLERAGYEVDALQYRVLSYPDLAIEVLGLWGMRLTHNTVIDAPDTSPFRAGDRIVAANGVATRHALDLVVALHEVAGGDEFVLQVLRDGTRMDVPLVMPAMDDSRHVPLQRLVVEIPVGGAPFSPLNGD